ncbi:MAG: hypothetical protein ABIK85_04460 [Candidatus Eisenbacteria bacterium]
MSTKTAIRVAVLAVLALALGLGGTAGARSMELGDGGVLEGSDAPRDIQETIWFQGFVGDAGTGEPVNATYTVTARMYDAEVGGASVWGPETHVATVITDGWFNIELGNVIGGLPAFDTPPYYLQLTIDGELLSPRLKLASVPSAFQSLGADNGLNLPYAGNYGSSGDAFSITNTGPNSCGYFRINNAASSATAVYGNHNGTGAALLGWHTGSGPALRAVANGSGLAGKFEGAVSIDDSLTVNGTLYARNNVIVPDTLVVIEGFWFGKNPVPGYVLRCADSWGNAEWGPPNIIDLHDEGATTTIGSSVAQYDDAQVTLTVPGPGYIVVESQLWVVLSHTLGTKDRFYCAVSTSPTAMPASWHSVSAVDIPSAWPTDTSVNQTLYVHETFPVSSSGTYTYYLVGYMASGQNSADYFWYSHMRGVWYPYPIPARADAEEDAEFLKKQAEFESR